MSTLNKDSHITSNHVDNNTPSTDCHQNVFEKRTNNSSSQVECSSVEPTACLITPPASIHISHMYVYNFSPDHSGRNSSAFDTPIKTRKYQSPAASSGPICRICHEGDDKEDLVSPCKCTGTVGLVHKTCMERWLSTRPNSNDKCEICNYTFVTARYPKSVLEIPYERLSEMAIKEPKCKASESPESVHCYQWQYKLLSRRSNSFTGCGKY
ncbi:unnamed protein product [Larinioides sclopetarius]|uniref:RING-CH-type domain-containing protein n=1 Tax=Larinioides sclopetarius TaxID=280406 RepID=A0AAV1Z418_9ARAC